MEEWKEEMLKYIFSIDDQSLDIDAGLAIKYNNIPSRLYKYYIFSDHNKRNLEKSVIWLSYPENFNDPYDCALTYSNFDLLNHFFPKNMDNIFKEVNFADNELTELEKEQIRFSKNSIKTFAEIMIKKEEQVKPEDRKKVLDALIGAVSSVAEDFESSFKNVVKEATLVSCFSEIKDSIIMWSHYADNHKGFCVEYDFKSLPYSNKITTLLYPIIYQHELLDVTEYMKIEKEHLNNIFGVRAAITKSKEWEYEREWRIIMPFGISKHEMEWDVPLPTSIYAGAKIEQKNKEFLKQYCERTKIPLLYSKMNEHMFKIDFVHE